MFRLEESVRRERTTIHIDGRLVAECARLLEQRCREAMAAGRRVQVVLGRLTGADETGCRLLAHLATLGVKLRALDLYAKELLRSIRRQAMARSRPPRGG